MEVPKRITLAQTLPASLFLLVLLVWLATHTLVAVAILVSTDLGCHENKIVLFLGPEQNSHLDFNNTSGSALLSDEENKNGLAANESEPIRENNEDNNNNDENMEYEEERNDTNNTSTIGELRLFFEGFDTNATELISMAEQMLNEKLFCSGQDSLRCWTNPIVSWPSKSIVSDLSQLSLNTSLMLVRQDSCSNQATILHLVTSPIILVLLSIFCRSIYKNDLFVAIPDRLLILVSLMCLLHNALSLLPLDATKNLLHALISVLLMWMVLSFWLVFTEDKVARAECWERNTRYYAKEITLSLALVLIKWTSENMTALSDLVCVSTTYCENSNLGLALILALVIFSLLYWLYLATQILIRVICCRPHEHYRKLNRLRLLLLYCLFTSLALLSEANLSSFLQWLIAFNKQSTIMQVRAVRFGALSFLNDVCVKLHCVLLLLLMARERSTRSTRSQEDVWWMGDASSPCSSRENFSHEELTLINNFVEKTIEHDDDNVANNNKDRNDLPICWEH